MLKECISSGMTLVSKEGLILYPLPRVHGGSTCLFISCLPKAVLQQRTWDLRWNSFFYISTHSTLILNSLSSCVGIRFLLFPEGPRSLGEETPSVTRALINLESSGIC